MIAASPALYNVEVWTLCIVCNFEQLRPRPKPPLFKDIGTLITKKFTEITTTCHPQKIAEMGENRKSRISPKNYTGAALLKKKSKFVAPVVISVDFLVINVPISLNGGFGRGLNLRRSVCENGFCLT